MATPTEQSMELILYRLDRIDGRLAQVLDSDDLDPVKRRIDHLENKATEQEKSRRQLFAGLFIALAVPSAGTLFRLIAQAL